ncbi:hypothetical protein RCC89_07700 [Cytophagaceae bacterium ABcell3]|nr:hypothetical protein RCC89_07700 [Cytophagaceae bacterium ABcell3]
MSVNLVVGKKEEEIAMKIYMIFVAFMATTHLINAQNIDYSKINLKDSGNKPLFQDSSLTSDSKELEKWRKNTPERCSLLKDKEGNYIKKTNNYYNVVNSKEQIEVRNTSKKLVITYKTALENFKYVEKNNGQYKYSYKMNNEGEYITLKRSYSGKIKFKENAPIKPTKAQEKLEAKINEAIRSCRIN